MSGVALGPSACPRQICPKKDWSASGSRLRLHLSAEGAPRHGALWNRGKAGTREPWKTLNRELVKRCVVASLWVPSASSLPSLPFEQLNPDVIPGLQNTSSEALTGPSGWTGVRCEKGRAWGRRKLFLSGIPLNWLETCYQQVEKL